MHHPKGESRYLLFAVFFLGAGLAVDEAARGIGVVVVVVVGVASSARTTWRGSKTIGNTGANTSTA